LERGAVVKIEGADGKRLISEVVAVNAPEHRD